jgi:site-specific recombinase XerD
MYKKKTHTSLGVAAVQPTASRFRQQHLPTSKIYIKKRHKDDDHGWLYVRVSYQGKVTEKSLGLEITDACFDPSTESILNSQKLTQEIWQEKKEFIDAITAGLSLAQQATGLTPTLKDAVDVVNGKTYLPETIMDIFDYEIERMKKNKGAGFTRANIQKHQVCRSHVAAMLHTQYGRNDVMLREISKKMVQTLMDYLGTVAGCGHNTIIKHTQVFKKMFKIALDNRWVDHNPFAGIKLGCKPVKRTVLTQEEVDLMANCKLKVPRLGYVRDLFVFSCYTGLAYIDLMNLQRKNLSDYLKRTWINISRQKSDVSASIPLLPPARFILERYHRSWRDLPAEALIFPNMSNQKINSYLKEVADICGIEARVFFHLSRHIFATTITLANNIPIESVSKMLGHTNLRQTSIYSKVIDQKIDRDMAALSNELENKYGNYGGENLTEQPGIIRTLRKTK